jgi:hypothetical protein
VGADPTRYRGRPPSTAKRARHAAGDPTGVVVAARTGHGQCATREVCGRGVERHLHTNGEPARASTGNRRWRMGSYYRRGRVTPAEGRSPAPNQLRKGSTVPVIDDESSNTARWTETSRPRCRRKLRLNQPVTGWKGCGRSLVEGDLPRSLLWLIGVPHRTAKHWALPKPKRELTKHSASTASECDASICRARRPDGLGGSRMREICTSGLTSGDWKRSVRLGMRHRHMAKAAGQRQLPQA